MKQFYLVLLGILILTITSCSIKKDMEKMEKQIKMSMMDTDKDGVSNIYDRQDSTFIESKVYGDGTEVDTDKDGVPDYMDIEIFSPLNAQVDSLGKAVDTDKDGVPDALDLEPDTKQGALVNYQGVSIEVNSGQKPIFGGGTNTAGNESKEDASVSAAQNAIESVNGLPIIFFKHSFQLEDFAYQEIKRVFDFLASNPGNRVKIIGHTDNIGSEDLNMNLGMRRAEVVAKVLIAMGIDESRLMVESLGESKPLVDSSNLTLNHLNRRVEFKVIQ